METMAAGMQNLRISQFFSQKKSPKRGDLSRLEEGLQFIRRSLAAVSYLQEGNTEGLEPIGLAEARYTSNTVKSLQRATDYPSFRHFLETLAASLQQFIERKQLPESQRTQLELFFEAVGEAMVSEVLDGTLIEESSDREVW